MTIQKPSSSTFLTAFRWISTFCFLVLVSLWPNPSSSIDSTQFWLKIRALDKFQRSHIADTGVAIQFVAEDYVVALGTLQEKRKIEKLGWLVSSSSIASILDFPTKDASYHNYTELTESLNELHQKYPQITELKSVGLSQQKRNIWSMRISGHLSQGATLPGALFLGGHHAREHLSVETPLRILTWILEEYAKGNPRIQRLVNSRDIHFIPAVNPDGLEYDIATGRYRMWRKNRTPNKDGTFGVDLNRNYGFGWGTGGSSHDPESDTFMGEVPFSEPETQAIKTYVEENTNLSVMLSFHTYSELILYPWGGKFTPISQQKDLAVFKTMAEKMSGWNGYTPEQASELYIASGDTTDWAYGQHGIFAFTFELDPSPSWGGQGFYPGAEIIPSVVAKNLEPALYLIEYSDNPYRVLNP